MTAGFKIKKVTSAMTCRPSQHGNTKTVLGQVHARTWSIRFLRFLRVTQRRGLRARSRRNYDPLLSGLPDLTPAIFDSFQDPG